MSGAAAAVENTARDVFPVEQLDSLAVFARLRRAVTAAGGQRAFAEMHDISPGYLNDVLGSRRDAGPAILAAIGVRRVVYFQVVGPAQ